MQQCLKKMPAEPIKAKFSPGEKETINQKYANDEPRCNNAWKNCPPNRRGKILRGRKTNHYVAIKICNGNAQQR